jgi:cytochrome c-type biogenesis protein CcmE
MEFVVTDLANEILVRYRGALPDLFREGHSVVAEGFVRPIEKYPGIQDSTTSERTAIVERAKECGCYFAATEVLAKHDEVNKLYTFT